MYRYCHEMSYLRFGLLEGTSDLRFSIGLCQEIALFYGSVYRAPKLRHVRSPGLVIEKPIYGPGGGVLCILRLTTSDKITVLNNRPIKTLHYFQLLFGELSSLFFVSKSRISVETIEPVADLFRDRLTFTLRDRDVFNEPQNAKLAVRCFKNKPDDQKSRHYPPTPLFRGYF